MNKTLRILIVEDSEDDVLLLLRTLRREGYEVVHRVVDTSTDMRDALEKQEWDVITSDHAMPRFSAPESLALAKELRPDLPFIILSGEIDINLAVSLMKGGAQDYIQKKELPLIVPAIARELEETEARIKQKQAEDALRVSEANARAIMNASLGVIILLDEHGIVIDNNTAHAERYGLAREEIIGRCIFDLMLPEIAAARRRAMKSVFETGHAFTGQDCRAGIWNEYIIYPVFDETGKVVRAVIYARDITERKLAEERIKILNDLIDIAPASITVHDFAGRFLYANQKTFDLHGYSREEFFSLKLQDIDIPASQELIAARMERIAQNGEASFEVTHFRKDGTTLPLWIHGKLGKWGDEQVLFSIATDMTKQKHKEAEIKRIGRLLAETEAVTRVGGWEYDAATGRITWTDEVYRIHGVGREYDPNDVKRNISFYSPVDEAIIEKHFRRAVEAGEPYDLELRFIRAGGEPIWVRTIGKPVMENGKVVRVMGNIMDISDRKAAAETLKESELKFRSLFESIKDGIGESDLQGRIVGCNQAYLDLTGHTWEEMRQLTYRDLTPEKWRQEDAKRIKQCFDQGYCDPYEKERLRKDGSVFPISIRIWLRTDKNGKPVGHWGIISDITERKRMEKQLQESELRYRQLFENSGTGMLIIDKEGKYLLINRIAADSLGCAPEEAVGRSLYDFLPETTARKHIEANRILMEKGGNRIYETDMALPGGERTMLLFERTLQDMAGGNYALQICAIDITERKQMEKALLESEKKYHDLFDNAVEGIFQTTFDGRIVSANSAYAHMFGYSSPQEMIAAVTDISTQLYADPEDRKKVLALFKESAHINNFECLMRRKDGNTFWVVMNARLCPLSDGSSCFEGFIFDISKRKQAEAFLKESEERFRIVSQSTSDAIWDWDIRKGTLNWLGDVDHLLAYNEGEFPRSIAAWEKSIHPHDHDRVMKTLDRHRQMRTPYVEEYRMIKKDGNICYWMDRGTAMYDVQGNAYRMIGSCTDITARKLTEEKLRESEERFRLLVENAPEGIFIQTHGQFAYINKAALKMFGATAEQLLGQPIMTRFHPDYHTVIQERVRLLHEERQEAPPMEQKYLKLDGTSFDVEVSAVPFLYKNRQGALVFFQDISERKLAEDALKESELRYRELSIVDNLTQLYNSRQFNNQLQVEIDRVNRYDDSLTLILFDIDNFKDFNDAYGHVEGDRVLMCLGQVVKKCLRKTDSAYRYGGEEFTIILPMTKKEDGYITAERIREEFKKEIFSPGNKKIVHVTISIGVDQYRSKESMKEYVHRVDQLMYQAKKNGKDRICVGS